ncbi:hyphal anastamosis 8 [Epichloe bromicola]|uniref:Hyphal anastamosis 8 n=1 Tax=Epichloe bromicola TaxID=79588 RepID=A0ABQ0CDV7_9HYPO
MVGKGFEEKKRPAALNLTPKRSDSSSTDNSLKVPRTPRFAEATSVHSPVDMNKSPFADPEKPETGDSQQPGVVGFGYISNTHESSNGPKSPLKSAMKVPGTPARQFTNPLSPTFREEEVLEKREAQNDQQQANDVKIKTRVRMAKFALRGVNFSCSMIILSMLSASFAIFNSTKSLAAASKFTPWAPNTQQTAWPQKLTLSMACVSLFACILVFVAYCRGGHKRATKVNTYYTMFAIGWFILSMLLWVITAVIFQHSKDSSNNKDMWGWACVNNQRAEIYADKVDYALVCRLQNWTLICIIIEIVVEVISISLYSIVFYRFYSKRRLMKSMDMRDRARSDLYLAQLRSQSAPNTPGFGPKSPGYSIHGPKSPALSNYAMSPRHPPATYRNLSDPEESSPFTPGGNATVTQPSFPPPQPGFKLQAPPVKAPSATPKTTQAAFSPTAPRAPSPPATSSAPQHAPQPADEPTYESVPIPGAYAGQAIKSPPPHQTTFGQAI